MGKLKRHLIPTCLFLTTFCTGISGCAVAPAPILDQSGDHGLAGLLESIRTEEKLPALAGAVIIDGTVMAAAAVGTRASNTKNWVTVDDSFLIASCSKAFTATLSAVLIEKGYLKWNTKLKEAYPYLDMRSEYEDITLTQLLSHRAGLPEWIGQLTSRSTGARFHDNWWHDRDPPMIMRAKYLEETVMQSLVDAPGASIYYSNSGYLMAAAVLEKMTGKAFEQLMAEEIFKPAGLHSAGFGAPSQFGLNNQPVGHSGISRSVHPDDFPEYMAPTSGIHISVNDWAKFILLHLGGNDSAEIHFDGKTLGILHSPPDLAPWRFDAEENGYGIPSLNYALGWYTLDLGGKKNLLWHPGGSPGFIAEAVVDPKRNNAVLLVTNARVSHGHLIRAINKIKAHYSPIADLPEYQ